MMWLGKQLFGVALAASLTSTVSGVCTLTCEVGKTCYSQPQEALDCLYSIPFNQVIKHWISLSSDPPFPPSWNSILFI
jgi:hypothetical protein